MIAVEFPPLNNTGAFRPAKMAKYLGEFGVTPIVVTVRAEDAAEAFDAPIERSLLDELRHVEIVEVPMARERWTPHTRLGKAARLFARVSDSIAGRIEPGLRATLPGLVARHRPTALLVTMPPFSMGPLAQRLAAELRLPLIVDMRDGWSHWCAGPFATYVHYREVLRRERSLFSSAARVVTVTEQLADVFRRAHPMVPRDRFAVVPNGMDVSAADLAPRVEPRSGVDDLVVGYVGSFYYSPAARATLLTPWWRRAPHRMLHYAPVREDWLYRSPYFFLATLAELRRRDPALGARVRFALVGAEPAWLRPMARELGVEDALDARGFVPRERVAAEIATFDALLATAVKVPGGEDYALASKTFDYVRGGRPVLALVGRGAQRDFLERAGIALVADPDDREACVRALSELVTARPVLTANREFLARYERRALAAELAALLNGNLGAG